MKNLEKMKKVVKEGSIETFIQKIKELPIYSAYEYAVNAKKGDDTSKLLQMSAMISAMGDAEFSMLMSSVSLDLLFVMVDQRLRNEILGEERKETDV